MVNEIKKCKCYSVQVDDTTDITQRTQCSIILRYVTDESKLVERFLGFFNVSEDQTAEGLFNLMNSVLQKFEFKTKLIGQCYDGASVMAGNLNGVQAKIRGCTNGFIHPLFGLSPELSVTTWL